MSNFALQGRLRLHTGHAQVAAIQGLHVPRSQKGGRGSIKSKRRMMGHPHPTSYTDHGDRISNQQKRWSKKSKQHIRPNCRN